MNLPQPVLDFLLILITAAILVPLLPRRQSSRPVHHDQQYPPPPPAPQLPVAQGALDRQPDPATGCSPQPAHAIPTRTATAVDAHPKSPEVPLLMRKLGADIELLYDQPPAEPPSSGWTTDSTGMVLRPTNPHARTDPPAGTYLPIGGPSRSGQSFINLQRARVLSITGHPQSVDATLAAARHVLQDRFDSRAIRLVELHHEAPDAPDPWQEIINATPAPDGHPPLAIIAHSTPPSPLLAQALDPASAVLVLTTADTNLGHQIRCEPDHLTLEPIGMAFPPPGPPAEPVPTSACPHTAPSDDQLIVRLLGPIDTHPHTPMRAKALAVLGYLACQRTATGDEIEGACWDSNRRTTKLRRNLIAELRNTVGAHRIPHADGDTYTLDASVTTDLELFDHHLELADQTSDPAAREALLRCALGLVRGPVFTYPTRSATSFRWIDDLNLAHYWEHQIEHVALDSARLAAQQHQVDQAIKTLDTALSALPHNTALIDQLLATYGEAGQLDQLRAAYEAHERWLRDAFDAEPEPSTLTIASRYGTAAR